jgi:hypothetical protein
MFERSRLGVSRQRIHPGALAAGLAASQQLSLLLDLCLQQLDLDACATQKKTRIQPVPPMNDQGSR